MRSTRSWLRIAGVGARMTLFGASLLLSACVLNRPLARQAEAIVDAARPHTSSCARPDHCAIDSPYQALADAARAASTPAAPVHYVDVLEGGADALLLRVHMIRAARRSIDMQTFIWAEDDAGWLVLDELMAAARRGVKVRVLVDQLFALDNIEWLARLARAHVNFEVKLYNPTFHEAVTEPLEFAAGILCCFSTFNQRMHNKLFLIDGQIGIAGGRNVENRYYDWDQEFDYIDRDVLVVGPSSGAQMQASFNEFWTHRRSVALTRLNDVNRRIIADADAAVEPEPPAHIDWQRIAALRARAADANYVREHFSAHAVRVARVDYFSDAPDKPLRPGDRADEVLSARIGDLLAHARNTIELQTPYLVLTRRARRIFRDLYKRTPRVAVIVSTNSLAATDAFYVYALSYKYKKRYLKRYGFQIHEFKPFPADAAAYVHDYAALAGSENSGRYRRYGRTPLKHGGVRLGLHSKSLVIDGQISVIGSHNFDPRSDDYNTESGFIIDDAMIATQVSRAIARDMQPGNSWTIARRERAAWLAPINEVMADISTALPLFDLWPFRYTSSFELKPGCAPSQPGDPAFYACHVDVGDFPEVDLSLKTIYTRIVTAFGAGLVGIL